jgi:hypothetical protein
MCINREFAPLRVGIMCINREFAPLRVGGGR